jgi:hypothetical protein
MERIHMKNDELSPIEMAALRSSYLAVGDAAGKPEAVEIARSLLKSPRAHAGLEYWQRAELAGVVGKADIVNVVYLEE